MSEEQRTQCAPRAMSELAREALQVQDACNPLGLTKSFAEATQELSDRMRLDGQSSTRAICVHPVFRMWAFKLYDLSRLGCSDVDTELEAYRECKRLAEATEEKCVGCGEAAVATCPECGKPTCKRAVALCGHVQGICGRCVADRLVSLAEAS